jgi:hypothetical protein
LLLLFETLDLLLESLDFVPRLQPTTHDAEVKLLHKEKILIHVQYHITGYLLLLEYIAVFRLDSQFTQMPRCLSRIPAPHLLLGRLVFLFFIGFMAPDVGDPMFKMAAIFARGIVIYFVFVVSNTMTRGAQVGYVLIDNTQGLIHNRAVLALQLTV